VLRHCGLSEEKLLSLASAATVQNEQFFLDQVEKWL